uniref:Cyanobacterial TRADD-N associated 2 transmembrane domain-containing protein n=1 Tax=uncultured Thiotrichaceae bacterium TaxID=298394 RepID=A0A6S6UHX0_9GAMM|nr:MAG: Unknown protein [uncultured Thiotrichaceae bacterium]
MNDSVIKESTNKPSGYFGDLLTNPARQEPMSKAAGVALKQFNDAKDEKDEVKSIASSQISLLSKFYDLSLDQAGRSFRWALIASVVGLLFFMAAIVFQVLGQEGSNLPMITLIGGALIEFIAGINFYLYGKTLSQLTLFQGRLEVTQRFLLANSLCNKLGDDHRDDTRAALIAQLASNSPYSKLSPDFHDYRSQKRRSERGHDGHSDTELRQANHPTAGHQPM